MSTDRARAMMDAIWLKAHAEGELVLNFPTKTDLARGKFMLYNAAKSVKNAPPGTNWDLEKAVEECMINKEGDLRLVIRHKALSPFLQMLGEQTGIDPATVHTVTEFDKEADESANRLVKRLEKEAADAEELKAFNERNAQVHNPYKRDRGQE